MGGGDKFNSALSTRGGRSNFITGENIATGDPLAKEILSEMTQEGIRFSKDKIVFAARLENGNKVFLEKDAVSHIISRHGGDFEKAFGIKSSQISSTLSDTISKGKLISSTFREVGGVKYYSNKYYHQGKYSVVYGIAENGYIETAYPKGGIE